MRKIYDSIMVHSIKLCEKKNSEFYLESFINPIDGTNTDGTLQIYPNNHDGMFIARIRKGGVKDGI